MPVGNSQEWYPSKLVNGDVDSRVCKQREIKNHHELRENIVESLGVIQKINILLKRLPSLVEKQNKPKQKTNKQTKTIAVIFGYKKKVEETKTNEVYSSHQKSEVCGETVQTLRNK